MDHLLIEIKDEYQESKTSFSCVPNNYHIIKKEQKKGLGKL
jgi:hypothetical protein